jgi:hypothetical protein
LTATYGATVTLNFDTANNWDVPMTGNPTMAYTANSANKGQRVFMRFLQDSTGGRVVAAWFSGINWNNNLPPVFDPRPNGIDVIGLECVSVDSYGNATWEEIYRKTSAPRKGIYSLTYGATIQYDARISPKQLVTLTGNPTLAIATSSQAGQYTLYAGQLFQVGLAQDGTGSRVATWFSGITSTPPPQSTGPGLLDWYLFCCRDPVTPKFDLVGYSLGNTL